MERFFTRGQRMSALLAESGALEDFIVPTVTMAEKNRRRDARAARGKRSIETAPLTAASP